MILILAEPASPVKKQPIQNLQPQKEKRRSYRHYRAGVTILSN